MGKITQNSDWERSIYWQFDPINGWDGYHIELSEVSRIIRENPEPQILIFQPAGDVPRGNPVVHMRRLVNLSKTEPKIIKTIIIMGQDWFIAKAFVNLLSSLMSFEPEVKLVFSMDEARAEHQQTLAAMQSGK